MHAIQNAGHRLWQVQRAQGTGLCVGLDPHLDPEVGLDTNFYRQFVKWDDAGLGNVVFRQVLHLMGSCRLFRRAPESNAGAEVLAGVLGYFLAVVDAAWASGIRVYKPQIAFFEGFGTLGMYILEALCVRLEVLAAKDKVLCYIILDAKRGDIDSTQAPYYRAYLTPPEYDLFFGAKGQFGFDAMTVTTWMGDNVLTPGLPFFRQGKGAIVVTRTSNPSGTTLQDMGASAPLENELELSAKQEPFRPNRAVIDEVFNAIDREPSIHEIMLWQTEKFSRDNGLNQDGVSPLFSVMGSTVKMLGSFRKLRPGGIALGPGFGEQSRGGSNPFVNIMPLHVNEGPLAGHIGILASSRAHNFPWMKKYGGSDDPQQLRGEMARMIDQFRADEKAAYAKAGYDYPF
jgi:orotidine 5'-phosphate decarboxylase subfamily 2